MKRPKVIDRWRMESIHLPYHIRQVRYVERESQSLNKGKISQEETRIRCLTDRKTAHIPCFTCDLKGKKKVNHLNINESMHTMLATLILNYHQVPYPPLLLRSHNPRPGLTPLMWKRRACSSVAPGTRTNVTILLFAALIRPALEVERPLVLQPPPITLHASDLLAVIVGDRIRH
jgi:hypothetical protein